jgi:hypothetical protein
MRPIFRGLVAAALLCGACTVQADETDQYLAWGVELTDSTETLNGYLNRQIQKVIDERNTAIEPTCECSSMVFGIYDEVFKGRLTAHLNDFLQGADDVDVYPPRTISRAKYQQMSIYRGVTFPYALPMSRTLRMGDIYFGEDKFGHFFAFGRRYYNRYLWYLKNGFDEDAAVEKVVRWGVMSENTLVGKGVDGIFSHADLEANYQGLLLARDLCDGEHALLKQVSRGQWELTEKVDLMDYINPYFDETYNPSHFWGRRRSLVLPLLREEYAQKAHDPSVIARFRKYNLHKPSLSVEIVRNYFFERGQTPQRDQVFSALGLPPDYPSLVFAGVPVP